MLERDYQRHLKKRLSKLFPGAYIMKQDSASLQGIPDLLILWNRQWAMLEVKTSDDAPNQPNQEFYVGEFGRMSFAAFISPDNEEEVLSALQLAFGTRGQARLSQPK